MFNRIRKFFADWLERERLKIVKQNGFNIHKIKTPSEECQLEAIRQNPAYISLILHPTLSVQMEVIKENPYKILVIHDKAAEAIEWACDKDKSFVLRNHFEKLNCQKDKSYE